MAQLTRREALGHGGDARHEHHSAHPFSRQMDRHHLRRARGHGSAVSGSFRLESAARAGGPPHHRGNRTSRVDRRQPHGAPVVDDAFVEHRRLEDRQSRLGGQAHDARPAPAHDQDQPGTTAGGFPGPDPGRGRCSRRRPGARCQRTRQLGFRDPGRHNQIRRKPQGGRKAAGDPRTRNSQRPDIGGRPPPQTGSQGHTISR